MNLADPELEFIDPTPDVHSLFVHFDALFFWDKLKAKAVVRWSKRMYSCAGVCSYEGNGRGGLIDIALSEPLLKLRPRKDLVETLLHEMIHGYLFIVGQDNSRDGHGPKFLYHMKRINHAAKINISVYHDFHDEVKLYQNHVWRCNGPCKNIRPYFGMIRRTCNKPPGPSDFWWNRHKRVCWGTFIKIREPENFNVKQVKQPTKKPSTSNGDITKYINNNNNTTINKNTDLPIRKSINSLNDTSKSNEIPVFTGKGQTLGKPSSSPIGVAENVRNVWLNKTLPINPVLANQPKVSTSQVNTNKRISVVENPTPPKKMKTIDDYFTRTATNILKDIYGKDFTITQSNDDKFKAVAVKQTLVDCPICNTKISHLEINGHVDECLNKDIIKEITKESIAQIEDEIAQKGIIKNKGDTTSKPTINVTNQSTKNDHTINNIFTKPEIRIETNLNTNKRIETEPSTSKDCIDLTYIQIKKEPSSDPCVDLTNKPTTECIICGKNVVSPSKEHELKCLHSFIFDNNINTVGSFGDKTIVIDDSDDEFDESQTYNATGTKSPCPCCMTMVENDEMNAHLSVCLV